MRLRTVLALLVAVGAAVAYRQYAQDDSRPQPVATRAAEALREQVPKGVAAVAEQATKVAMDVGGVAVRWFVRQVRAVIDERR